MLFSPPYLLSAALAWTMGLQSTFLPDLARQLLERFVRPDARAS